MQVKITAFEPQKDITAYELAMCTKIMNNGGLFEQEEWEQYDVSITRHFEFERWDHEEWKCKVKDSINKLKGMFEEDEFY